MNSLDGVKVNGVNSDINSYDIKNENFQQKSSFTAGFTGSSGQVQNGHLAVHSLARWGILTDCQYLQEQSKGGQRLAVYLGWFVHHLCTYF